MVVEIDGPLDQAQAEQSLAEIEIGLRLVHRRGDVVQAEQMLTSARLIARTGSSSRSWKSKLKSTAGEVGAILTWSMVPSGLSANVT